MNRGLLTPIAVLLIALLVFFWAQQRILDVRAGVRIEEKILMLSDNPEVTKRLAMGFDNALADLLWIRAIQYFGGNFSTLDVEDKRDGMEKLFNNLVHLDPKFIDAWLFGGFVMNEAMRDSSMAIDFLLRGAEVNPDAWKLPFDAGFIMFYHLENFDGAKDLFIRATYGEELLSSMGEDEFAIQAEGLLDGFDLADLYDGDAYSQVMLTPETGSLTLEFDQPISIGFLGVEPGPSSAQSYRFAYSLDGSEYLEISSGGAHGYQVYNYDEQPLLARFLRMNELGTDNDHGFFTLAGLQVYGPRNPETPSYVPRMAAEMDRSSGRFMAAWNQLFRYYMQAAEIGDQITMDLTLEKLNTVYDTQVQELLVQAVELYYDEKGELPSQRMFELVQEPYLDRVVRNRINEDPSYRDEVLEILLLQTGELTDMLTTFNGEYPQMLLVYPVEGAEDDWEITTQRELLRRQTSRIDHLERLISQFQMEEGRMPVTLREIVEQEWYLGGDDILTDPMGGEFFINPETGRVESRNSIY